ncbi:hypothetical protein L6V77_33335 [Myxococcota bacterium]|nr:hypothetical protein [Myxococcota bacterium]
MNDTQTHASATHGRRGDRPLFQADLVRTAAVDAVRKLEPVVRIPISARATGQPPRV